MAGPLPLSAALTACRCGATLRHHVERGVSRFIPSTLLLDQERLIGADLRWFGDFCHFNDEGTARFIENIADFIVQRRLFDRLDQDQIHSVDAAEAPR
jgi:hypothetical protein